MSPVLKFRSLNSQSSYFLLQEAFLPYSISIASLNFLITGVPFGVHGQKEEMKKPEFKMPSVKLPEKLSSILKSKSQPVFNRPVCTERQYRVSRAIYITLLTLMVGVSMAVIGLKAMTLVFIEDNNDTGFMFETGDPEPTLLAALPRQLYTAPAKLALVAAVMSLCIGVVHSAFVILDWKDGKKVRFWPPSCGVRRGRSLTVPRHNRTPSGATPCFYIS